MAAALQGGSHQSIAGGARGGSRFEQSARAGSGPAESPALAYGILIGALGIGAGLRI